MAFADDVVLLTRSREELAKITNALRREVDKMRLEINKDKTKLWYGEINSQNMLCIV